MPAPGPWCATTVICRAEGRADERPLRLWWGGEWLEVERLLSTRLERGPGEGDPTWRVFEVQTAAGAFRLRITEPGCVWQCRPIPVALTPTK